MPVNDVNSVHCSETTNVSITLQEKTCIVGILAHLAWISSGNGIGRGVKVVHFGCISINVNIMLRCMLI